jgi:hypothetical protein
MIAKFCPGRLRAITSLVVAGGLLVGCAGGGVTNDANLSPAENQLRQSSARFNQTVGEGALTGAALGGIAGLALGGNNRVQTAMLGAAVGGALGTGAGYMVARNNLSRSSTEAQFSDAIKQATVQADAYRNAADASRQIADRASADVAQLKAQYRTNQITQAKYQAGIARIRQNNDLIGQQITQAQQAAVDIRKDAEVASGSDKLQLIKPAADIEADRKRLEQDAVTMSRALAEI